MISSVFIAASDYLIRSTAQDRYSSEGRRPDQETDAQPKYVAGAVVGEKAGNITDSLTLNYWGLSEASIADVFHNSRTNATKLPTQPSVQQQVQSVMMLYTTSQRTRFQHTSTVRSALLMVHNVYVWQARKKKNEK